MGISGELAVFFLPTMPHYLLEHLRLSEISKINQFVALDSRSDRGRRRGMDVIPTQIQGTGVSALLRAVSSSGSGTEAHSR